MKNYFKINKLKLYIDMIKIFAISHFTKKIINLHNIKIDLEYKEAWVDADIVQTSSTCRPMTRHKL